MKYISFSVDGLDRVGVVKDAGVVDATGRFGITSINELFAQSEISERLMHVEVDFSLQEIVYRPVIPYPSKIFCVGLNYRTHLEETGRELPTRPTIFIRLPSSQVGHLQPMIRPRASEKFDFEGELAVVIGHSCRHVPVESAMSVVAGYSIYNDGSIRDWQRHTSQFTPGKNFPKTGAFGPYVVTPDEVPDIRGSTLMTRLNGQEVQRAVISDMIFDLPELISYCSTFSHLEPGDVIVTGTPGGVGSARKPPVWLTPDDVVEVEISGVGLLMNPIGQEE